jgi:hypothetical protein
MLCATSCRNTACHGWSRSQGMRISGKGLLSPNRRESVTPLRIVAGEYPCSMYVIGESNVPAKVRGAALLIAA